MSENQPPENPDFTKKQLLVYAYLAIAALFTIWNAFFGSETYRGFFFNFGRSLVWPFQVFPIFGRIIGSILIVVCIVVFVILDPPGEKRREDDY